MDRRRRRASAPITAMAPMPMIAMAGPGPELGSATVADTMVRSGDGVTVGAGNAAAVPGVLDTDLDSLAGVGRTSERPGAVVVLGVRSASVSVAGSTVGLG